VRVDAKKAATNLRKHGVSFEEASGCVAAPAAVPTNVVKI
jgi:uncharacterized DUF497 family protein